MPKLEQREKTYCDVIAAHMAGDDISNFLNWKVIRYTMFAFPLPVALFNVQSQPDWDNKWKEAIAESPVGNPPTYPYYNKSSGSIIHQANHLIALFSKTKCRLETLDGIYEFGAGYGCMCRLIHRLGFSGEYTIMDLPVMLDLQRFYLGATVEGNINFVSEAAEFTEQMKEGDNLFIATWSLSEVPYHLRDEILGAVCANVKYVLLAVGTFGSYNNDGYFAAYIESNTSHYWHKVYIPYLAHLGCYYLFGERK